MEGLYHSREQQSRYFGTFLDNVFIYTGLCHRETENHIPEEHHLIYLKLSEDALEWKPLSHSTGENDPSDHNSLFELSLSPNLAMKDNLTTNLAGALNADVYSTSSVVIQPQSAFGFSSPEIWFRCPEAVEEWQEKLKRGRLFLDFLFDLEYGKVFTSYPHIKQVEARLLEHPLVNAIHDKAQCYWARQKYDEDKAHFMNGSSLFSTSDVKDWNRFLSQLASAENADESIGKEIWMHLPESTQNRIKEDAESCREIGEQEKFAIIKTLNDLLDKQDFYKSQDLSDLDLPPETQKLLHQKHVNLPENEVQKINRLLLERAYPNEIMKIQKEYEAVLNQAAFESVQREREWLAVCLSNDSENVLKSGRDWFESIEDEVARAIIATEKPVATWPEIVTYQEEKRTRNDTWVKNLDTMSIEQDTSKRLRRELQERTARWFLNRYDLNSAACILLLCLHELLCLHRHVAISNLSSFVGKIARCLISGMNIVIGLATIVLLVFSVINSVDSQIGLRITFNISILLNYIKEDLSISPVFLLTIGTIILVSLPYLYRKFRPSFKLPQPVSKSTFFIITATTFLYLAMDLGVFHHLSKECRSLIWVVWAIGIPIIFACVFFFFVPIVLRLLRSSPSLPVLLVRLLMPRLIFAVIAAWLIFSETEELWKADLLASWEDILPAALILLPITLAFITIEIVRKIHGLTRALTAALKRGVLILGVGICISFFVGAIVSSARGRTMILNSGFLEEDIFVYSAKQKNEADWGDILKEELKPDPLISVHRFNNLRRMEWGGEEKPLFYGSFAELYPKGDGIQILYLYEKWGHQFLIFPGLILYRALMALFVGFFLQLIFESRPITESF